jgi:nucleoside-diphosphate-sugar epimerase
MKILITGAGGFLGKRLAHTLATKKSIHVNGEGSPISRIYAADINADFVSDLITEYDNVEALAGDLGDSSVLGKIEQIQPDIIVHLAAVVSSAAEADFDLGLRVNLHATEALIQCCRKFASPPVLIFSSSLAVFGCEGNAVINDDHIVEPRSSYGTQKVMGEYLVCDASRKGFIHGRTVRFPTITVRPGKPNKAASSFVSGIIREPLSGEVAILPASRKLRLFIASPQKAIDSIVHAISLEQRQLSGQTTITLPGLSVTVTEMLISLEKVAGASAVKFIDDKPDDGVREIVNSWPSEIITHRARELGFTSDDDFEQIILNYIAENNIEV